MREGSTRWARSVRPGVVDFVYTKGWSAFDRGRSPQEIPEIDVARCDCAVKSFELAHKAEKPTHFLERVNEVTIRVKEFSVPGEMSISGSVHGHVIPLEFIWRTHVWGSLWDRLQQGIITKEKLGFAPDAIVEKGTKLPKMTQECTTKFDPTGDRHLTDEEAQALANLSSEQWEQARRLVAAAVTVSNARFEKVGYFSPDGKIELGMTHFGEIVIVDVFGTQDENRIIRMSDGAVCCKDIQRDYLTEIGWKAELKQARDRHPNDKSMWPPYPSLPAALVDTITSRYTEVGVNYRGT